MHIPPINLWSIRSARAIGLWLGLSDLVQFNPREPAPVVVPRRAGCWTEGPRPHPGHAEIADMACGYDHKLTDPACAGCWLSRPGLSRTA